MDKQPRSHYYLQICKSIVRYFFLCIKYSFQINSNTKAERKEYLLRSISAMEKGTTIPFKPIGLDECCLGLKYSLHMLNQFFKSKNSRRQDKSCAGMRHSLVCRFRTYFCSHCWLATPQEVLQALWQEVWHSPQPPFLALSQRFLVSRVLILLMVLSPL